jgi:hypothetical protein
MAEIRNIEVERARRETMVEVRDRLYRLGELRKPEHPWEDDQPFRVAEDGTPFVIDQGGVVGLLGLVEDRWWRDADSRASLIPQG